MNDLLQPRGILARNDPRTRLLEGLEQRVEVLVGRGARSRSPSAKAASSTTSTCGRARRPGCFSISGRTGRPPRCTRAAGCSTASATTAASRCALGRRCQETIAFDISEDAVARLRANAARNGVAVDARVGNVFDELRGLERLRERFDTIVLDPPAFAKNKAAIAKATAGYKEINLRALKLLNPGGMLVTCSCSYNISEAAFAEIVYERRGRRRRCR